MSLAPIDSTIQPVLIQINPDLFNDPTFDLLSFNIEIVSEEVDGFIVAASLDNLRALEDKINGFINSDHGTGKIADFWQIVDQDRAAWKPEYILSEVLYSRWPTITDEEVLKVEVGIAFDRPLRAAPDQTKQGGATRFKKYLKELEERDNSMLERQDNFEEFIRYYGQLISGFIDLEDSFSCEVEITGKGLKDLVENYQFVFEINELEEIDASLEADTAYTDKILEILEPEEGSPIVGVIDSGVQEGHKYLELGIDQGNSKSYIDGDNSTADHVGNGGHGTRVAGAILYPNGITGIATPYQLPAYIRNLRVLNPECKLNKKYPARLMLQIVEENSECRIFNLSINSTVKYRSKHMSSWAAVIDNSMHSENVLFVLSAGNIGPATIRNHTQDGKPYPEYLNDNQSKIANPGQSVFAITVGSINHTAFDDENWVSIGGENEVSAFSRSGLGIWDTIKPDVVTYGGGMVFSKNGTYLVKEKEETSLELVRSTLSGGGAIAKDQVGTSFAAPRVSYILAQLSKLYPDESCNLLRALLVQGARLPNGHFRNPVKESIQYYGYGLPSIERVISNTESRVTFYNTGEVRADEAHVYLLQIPDALRDPADDYDILIEITLAFTAKVRRTRQRLKSYLSTWLDWETSKLGESYSDFSQYILKELNGEATDYNSEERKRLDSLHWTINSRSDRGDIDGVRRTNSTLQKDWAFLKSYDLPKELSLAIRGHKGWDKDKKSIPYAVTVSIEVLGANVPIYESLRIENEIEAEV